MFIYHQIGKIWRELQTSEGMRLSAFGFHEEDAEHSAVICINAVKLLLLKVAVLRNYSTSLKVICCKMKTVLNLRHASVSPHTKEHAK